ncbi:DUF6510 family protein [Nocardiopsis metallicus]|uniref:Uncharacterized protein n=1 Tax=Nocardiopsis metallicus TaxID=179819 RepID=A0A840WUC3_9ACTN|nr:DUF6510 family protein [Nocardiopsis metallicus]MBB5495156.1 hypothetical protein [Nocardiopsis metallicus]
MNAPTNRAYLDGNVLAGPLSEVFAVDVTAAERRCARCGDRGAFAQLRVHADGPGLVACCPNCEVLVLRLVRTPDGLVLDLGGTGCITLPVDG